LARDLGIVTIHEVGAVDEKPAPFGIGIAQKFVIDKLQTEGIGDEDNEAPRHNAIIGLGNISAEAMDGGFGARGLAARDSTTEAVGARHGKILVVRSILRSSYWDCYLLSHKSTGNAVDLFIMPEWRL
jgi:hypothetical protein